MGAAADTIGRPIGLGGAGRVGPSFGRRGSAALLSLLLHGGLAALWLAAPAPRGTTLDPPLLVEIVYLPAVEEAVPAAPAKPEEPVAIPPPATPALRPARRIAPPKPVPVSQETAAPVPSAPASPAFSGNNEASPPLPSMPSAIRTETTSSTVNPAKEPAYQPPRADAAYFVNPKPNYPRAARQRGLEGVVRLDLDIDSEGCVTAIALAASSGAESLDRAAIQAVKDWRFRPAMQDGRPIAARVQVPIRFELNVR